LAGFETGGVFRRPQPPGWRMGMPAAFNISGCGLPANPGGLFNPTKRPAKLAQRDDLLLLFFAQDIAQGDRGYSSRLSNVLIAFSLAGFQVTTIGRLWVTAEAGLIPLSGE